MNEPGVGKGICRMCRTTTSEQQDRRPGRTTGVIAAIVAALALGLIVVSDAQAQDKGQADSRKAVRLVIADFVKLAGDTRFDGLSRSFAELLQVAFLSYDVLQVVPRGDLWAKFGDLHGFADPQAPTRVFAPDVLKAVRADFVLRGTFVELSGTLRVSAELQAVGAERQIKLDPVSIGADEVFAGAGILANEVIDALGRTQAIALRPRTFALTCFEDRSATASSLGTLLKRDLAMLLPGHVGARPARRVLPWTTVEGFCDKRRPLAELARSLRADAVVGGTIKVEAARVSVQPEVFISEYGLALEIPTLEGSLEQYLKLIADVGKKIREFADAGLTDEGKWRVAELVGTKLDAEAYLKRGRELSTQGDLALAVLFFEKSAGIKPLAETRYQLGLARLGQNRFEEAAEELLKALALQSDLAAARKALGDAYVGARRYGEAIDAYNEALRLDSTMVDAYAKLGNIYFFDNKYGEAKDYYQKALAQDPRNAEMYYSLAVVADRQSEATEAFKWLKKALEVSPDYTLAKRGLGVLYHRNGLAAMKRNDYAQAIADFTEEISFNANPEAHYLRAISSVRATIGQRSADYSSAIADYEIASRSASGDPRGWPRFRASTLTNLTEVFLLAHRYADASILSQRLVEELPPALAGYRVLARFLLVTARMLAGQEHEGELTRLRADLTDGKYELPNWDFSMLDDAIAKDSSVGEAARALAVSLSQEVQRVAKRDAKN